MLYSCNGNILKFGVWSKKIYSKPVHVFFNNIFNPKPILNTNSKEEWLFLLGIFPRRFFETYTKIYPLLNGQKTSGMHLEMLLNIF